jgi:hypothetical protein
MYEGSFSRSGGGSHTARLATWSDVSPKGLSTSLVRFHSSDTRPRIEALRSDVCIMASSKGGELCREGSPVLKSLRLWNFGWTDQTVHSLSLCSYERHPSTRVCRRVPVARQLVGLVGASSRTACGSGSLGRPVPDESAPRVCLAVPRCRRAWVDRLYDDPPSISLRNPLLSWLACLLLFLHSYSRR